jgi:tetratricopeptide (TPR) repeat protein
MSAGAVGAAPASPTASSPAPASAARSESPSGAAEPTTEAANPEVLAEARQRFDRGLELYADGDYPLALIEFRRAHALVPHYRVLYNIGQVSVQLGSYADARRAFEDYLAQGGDQIAEDRRQAVTRDVEMLRRRTAFLTVDANVAGAEVLVDDVLVGQAPLSAPLLVDAGVHRVTVRHQGYTPRSSRVTLAGGDEETLQLALEKVVKEKQTIVVREAAPEDSDALMIAGWVTTGALTAGAIVTGIMGAGEAKELQELRRSNREDVTNLPTRLESAQSNARSLLLASDVFSGAALVVGSLSLWVTVSPGEPSSSTPRDKSREPTPELELGYQQGQLKLRGHF